MNKKKFYLLSTCHFSSPVVPDVARTPTPSWSGLGFSFSSQVPLPSLGKIWEPSTSQQNRSENEAHSSGFPSRHKYPVGMTYSNIADSGNFPSGFFDDIDDVSSLLWKLDLQRYISWVEIGLFLTCWLIVVALIVIYTDFCNNLMQT